MAHAYRMGSNAARRVAHTGATVAKGAAGAAVGGVLAGKTLAQNRAAIFEQGRELSKELQANGMSKEDADRKVFGRFGKGVGGWVGATQRQMHKEDIAQRVKSKFGYTSNSSRKEEIVYNKVRNLG